MGVSTDAILAFGIDLGDGEEIAEDSPIQKLITEHDDCELDDAPVEIVYHCSYDYPMYILAVKGTQTKAYRGTPQAIDPAKMTIDPAAIDSAKAFAEARGIEWKDPKWWLCSMWG